MECKGLDEVKVGPLEEVGLQALYGRVSTVGVSP
jgi:hypothetical protein